MRKTIAVTFLVFLLFCCSKPLKAQQKDKLTPLHKYFQAKYDSTIIYHNWSSWYTAPNYIIIAKQKQKVYLFTYTSPYKKLKGKQYSEKEVEFQLTVPDVNSYLIAQNINQKELQDCWKQLNVPTLWKVESRQMADIDKCAIEDADENTFYFIAKSNIRRAHFYAPAFFEECSNTDKNRRKAINAIEILVGALNTE